MQRLSLEGLRRSQILSSYFFIHHFVIIQSTNSGNRLESVHYGFNLGGPVLPTAEMA